VLRLEFSTPGDGTDWTEYRRSEADVLGHWYGDSLEELEQAYGPYEDRTVFVALRRPDERVVGFCRLILPGPRGLKTISDVEKAPWSVDGRRAAAAAGMDVDRTWDIATLGVDRRLGGGGQVAAAALYYAVINAARTNGYPWIAAIIDSRARSLLAAHGLILHALPGTAPASYMGSPACAPVYAHLPEMLDHQRRVAPEAYRLIALGVGLDGIVTPAPDSFRLPADWGSGGDGSVEARSA
jgi:hypothetical protein